MSFTLESIIVLISTGAAFLTVIAVGPLFFTRQKLASRVKAISQYREDLSLAQKKLQTTQSSRIRQQQAKTYMQVLVDRLKLLNPAKREGYRVKLGQAGLRSQGHVVTYVFLRFIAPFIFSAVAALYLFLIVENDYSNPIRVLMSFGAGVVGFYIPQVLLSNMVQKRQQSMQKAFPDALDLMVICVESGVTMDAAIKRVSEELLDTAPELSDELALTTAELAFLSDRNEALYNFSKRTGLKSVESLVTVMLQSEKYGTPVGGALKVLADEFRDERLSAAEKKAGALPAQLTVPMIVFFLPVLFVVLLGPAILSVMKQF